MKEKLKWKINSLIYGTINTTGWLLPQKTFKEFKENLDNLEVGTMIYGKGCYIILAKIGYNKFLSIHDENVYIMDNSGLIFNSNELYAYFRDFRSITPSFRELISGE